jgi:Retroviral aspartyl protease
MLGRPRSGAANIYATRPPIIHIYVAYDKTWNCRSDGLPNHSAQSFDALLDTGADGTSIDSMLATQIGAETTKRAVVHGHTGNQIFSGTRVQIVIPTAQVVFCDDAVINDFRGAGSPWDAILGRSFLHHCKMQVDGPAERYYLEWVA